MTSQRPEVPDHYKTLQVHPEADQDMIQAAYRRLAQRLHPDHSDDPEAQAHMAEINAAWAVLRDPQRRAEYDRERRYGPGAVPGTGSAPGADSGARTHMAGTHTTDRPDPGPAPRTGAAGSSGTSLGGRQASTGTVLDFGRYAGWSLGEIARRDVEYLEWLDRAPIGRAYRTEIDEVLRRIGRRRGDPQNPQTRGGLFRRG